MKINTGFCKVSTGTSAGFGALVNFPQAEKRHCEAICIIPDNVVNINNFLQWTCNVKKPIFGRKPSKLTATINYLKPYQKTGRKEFGISKLYYHDCHGLLCFQIKSEDAANFSLSFYDYDRNITQSNINEIVVFRGEQFERFKLSKIIGEKNGILKVLIPEQETAGLQERNRTYPVFKEFPDRFQFIGFLYLISGTECDVVLCKEIKKVLCEGKLVIFSNMLADLVSETSCLPN